MLVFSLYAILLLAMGIFDARHGGNVPAFFLNGRLSGSWHTGFSLIASCIGGSATIGMAGLAWKIGSPAFWWLGSGACGLIILALFLAKRIRESEVYTMPELVSHWLGHHARTMVSAIIIVAWLAILAAQFTAMGKLVEAMTGLTGDMALLCGSLTMLTYACLGGQSSVIRSDLPQCVLLVGGLLATCLWLLGHDATPLANLHLELVNDQFGMGRFSYFMIILGGSYLVCPMLYGRILSARDSRCAVRGCWLGVAGILASAAVVVAVGVLCRGVVPPTTATDKVLVALMDAMPPWLALILLISLLSAVLSSADSCILTAATVLSNDILKKRSVRVCRLAILALGAGGILLAFRGHGILDLLLMANDIYVCGVVAPVFTAMILKIRPPVLLAELALSVGGICGLLSSVCECPAIGYAGMATAAILITSGKILSSRIMANRA